MYGFAYLHCTACQGIRRFDAQPILERLPGLGSAVRCAACSHSAFTLVERRGLFCPDCDSICLARIEPSPVAGASVVCCSRCGLALARLHTEKTAG